MNTEMNTSTPSKNIISNENYNEDMGYLVERYDNGSIYTTFWVFTNNGEKINEKIIIYKSLRHLYDESKIYVDSCCYIFKREVVQSRNRCRSQS